MKKIIKAEIQHPDRWGSSKVIVTYDDGSTELLLEFYRDEISFSPEEFIGLTAEAGHEVFHKKDVAYLRS